MVKPKKEAGTYKETLLLFQSGLTVDKIALKRKLGLGTIISHLAKLYLDGETVDLHQFVSKHEVKLIYDAYLILEKTTALKPYFDYLDEKLGYDKIRLALAIIEKENRPT